MRKSAVIKNFKLLNEELKNTHIILVGHYTNIENKCLYFTTVKNYGFYDGEILRYYKN